VTRHEETIRDQIQDAFRHSAELENANVEPFVSDGVVTLAGEVDDWHAAFHAYRLASEIGGVVQVRVALVVRPDIAAERGPLETEFRNKEDAWFMVSPDYRWMDEI
jgi:hypothetical protein